MSVDVACAEPAFLDLTMTGLEAIPAPGEERMATDFLRSPGGGAITAVGAARLGLSSSLVSPLGEDAVGILLRSLLADDGVRWDGRLVERTPVTVIMPTNGDRAMATFDPGEGVTADELAAVEPRAVVLSIPRLPLAPAGARVYVSIGDVDARALAGGELPAISAACAALLVNEREALLLTGAARRGVRGGAAGRSARRSRSSRLGADGALAAGAEGTVRVPGVRGRRRGHHRRRRPVRRRLRLGRPLGGAARAAAALGGAVCITLGEGRDRGCGRGHIEGALGGGR